MSVAFRERSRITAKGQTTVPKSVRQALGVSYGGEIGYVVDEYGVRVVRVEEATDPIIESFLDFLAQDMQQNPHKSIVALPESLAERMMALTRGATVDLDEDIDGPVSL
jgi:antitoxin PrlF